MQGEVRIKRVNAILPARRAAVKRVGTGNYDTFRTVRTINTSSVGMQRRKGDRDGDKPNPGENLR